MKLEDVIKQIDEYQSKISNYGKFSKEILNKINYKLRLDWNYYSNRMEGGTLTKEETRSVMVGNVDVKGKPFKDVAEMTGHDKVVRDILKMSKGELRISEKRIKEIHKAIMHEEDNEKEKEVGEWKSKPNEIINYRDEKISFTQPLDVAEEMHNLLNTINAELDKFFSGKKSKHPLEIAAQFHIDFVTIHPFYDGNGRTSRILTNIILIACGLPPIIIKDWSKKSYYQLLADIQAYGGKPDLFYTFIGERIIDTQKLILDALEGKDIEEEDDVDKKLSFLEKELSTIDPDEEVKVRLNEEVFKDILKGWVSDLIKAAVPEVQKFNRLFTGTRHQVYISKYGSTVFTEESAEEILEKFHKTIDEKQSRFDEHDVSVRFHTHYGTLKKGGLKTFGCNYSFDIEFELIKYTVFVDEFSEDGKRSKVSLYERLLHKPLTKQEINVVVKKLKNAIFDHIDFNTKKSGLRSS